MSENPVTAIAKASGRDYITPEDVGDALASNGVDAVRMAVLEVLGKQIEFGFEDGGLCAFIAWRGEP
jgi:precorrin-6B methylase 1